MKYIIFENNLTGGLHPIVFDEEFTHSMVYSQAERQNLKPISAGFILVSDDGSWTPYGKSVSLKLGVSPLDVLILVLFQKGISGLDLQNQISLLNLKKA